MGIPAAVQRADELADKLYQEAYGKPEAAQKATEDVAPAPVTPQNPPTESAPSSDAKTPPTEPDTWEQRFKVLNGKYSAEVPRMAAENRTLRQEVGTLTESVGKLTKQLEDVTSKIPLTPLVKPEEVQEYGEPLMDVVGRRAQEVFAQQNQASARELSQVRNEVNDLKKSAAEIQWYNFIDLLTTMVPDWATANVDPAFLKWLEEVDELSGVQRQVLLDRAKDARDASRAARFFMQWKALGQNKAAASRNALEQHVTPDSSSRTVVPEGKQIITRAQVAKFYSDVRAGRYSKEQEAAMEREIDAATIEGRIR